MNSLKEIVGRFFNIRRISRGKVHLMNRYYIYPRRQRERQDEMAGGDRRFTIRLHNLISSDPGDLHDHPFAFTSLILKGGYHETTPEGTKWKRPGSIIRHKAVDAHRLTIPEGGAWSIVVFGRRVREWGFYTKDGWVPWYEYPDE